MSEPSRPRIDRLDYFPGVGEIAWARVAGPDEPVKIVAWSLDRSTASNNPPATGPFRWWALVQDMSGQLVTVALAELVPMGDAHPEDDATLPAWWNGIAE